MVENRRGKDGRFYFSRSQMILLGAAFTAASLIIFVLGVFVGKGIEGRKLLKKEEPLVKIPIKPGAAESSAAPAPPSKTEFTFNDTLPTQPAAAVAPEEPRAAPKLAEKASKTGTKNGAGVKNESQAGAKIAEKKPERAAPAAETVKKTAAAETADAKDQKKSWRAQVNAFPDENSAKQIVDRLKNKGYNAYVTEVQNQGKSWYRVNVGRYNSRDEADKMAELLRTKENYPKAFAASR